MSDLANEHKISKRTLQRIFADYLDNPPEIQPRPNNKSILLIDGTWFNRESCLVVYYDLSLAVPQLIRCSDRERFDEMVSDLEFLKQQGVNCIGAVSDGSNAILSALRAIFDDVPKQRCLVHVQRQTLTWITQRPRMTAGIVLRKVCLQINQIQTSQEKDRWLKLFMKWDRRFDEFLKERTYDSDNIHWRYAHRSLRKVRRHLFNALPDMFHYLENPALPKDTNRLEGGLFSWLKNRYRLHRGIKKTKRFKFLKWYLYFKYFDNR